VRLFFSQPKLVIT